MDQSPLNKIAAELRNQIYELVLTAPGPISGRFSFKDQTWIFDLKHRYGDLLAITRTCKAIHSECDQMIWSLNTFGIDTTRSEYLYYNLRLFRSFMGAGAAALVRSIAFDIGTLDTKDWDWLDLLMVPTPQVSLLQAKMGSALSGLRDVAEMEPACHFELRFKLYCLDNFELKLDAQDLDIMWDDSLGQLIPEKENEDWTASRIRAIQVMKKCRREDWEAHKNSPIAGFGVRNRINSA